MDDAVMDPNAPNGVTGGVATTSGSSSMSQKELREARRKRIMERGRDRLAYITGEMKTLPPTAAGSNPGEMGLKTLANPGELPVSDFTSAELPAMTSPPFDTTGISQRLTNVKAELDSLDAAQADILSEPLPTSTSPPDLPIPQQRVIFATSTTGETATSSNVRPKFSYSALSKSVDLTKSIRALLAFLLAVLLVINWTYLQCQQPLGVGKMIYIPRWPVSMVLITDVTLVVGALLVGFVKTENGKVTDKVGLTVCQEPDLDNLSAMSSLLEGALDVILLVTKASTGLFADICIYMVTIVCAVSLQAHFRPSICSYIIR